MTINHWSKSEIALPAEDLEAAAKAARRLELSEPGRSFTFLTCTNAGAAKLNAARVRIEFPSIDDELQAGKGVRADPQQSGELHVFHVGMVV